MAQQHINLGTQSDGKDGDTNRMAWEKTEQNFIELYGGAMSVLSMKNKFINSTAHRPFFSAPSSNDLP